METMKRLWTLASFSGVSLLRKHRCRCRYDMILSLLNLQMLSTAFQDSICHLMTSEFPAHFWDEKPANVSDFVRWVSTLTTDFPDQECILSIHCHTRSLSLGYRQRIINYDSAQYAQSLS